jgi:uncharacterized protein YceK
MHQPAVIAILALSAALCGCGTMVNITNSSGSVPPKPFGGVGHDLDALFAGDFVCGLDIPASLIGDVVTLPDVLIENADFKRTSEPPVGDSQSGSSKKGAASRGGE